MGMMTDSGWREDLADTPENQAAYGVGGGEWNGTQTTGQTYGGGGGPAPAPQMQQFDASAFGNALRDATSPLFSQISGFERERLAQENAQFIQQLQLERDKLERLGIPELQIRQQLASLEMEHTRRMDALQEELSRGQLALARQQQIAELTGSFYPTLAPWELDLTTYEGRQKARDAGYWVGTNAQGQIIAEPGHPGGQANITSGAGMPMQTLAAELGRGQLGLDRDRFGLEQELGRGQLGLDRDRFGLEQELGRGNLGVSQGRLGLDYLSQAAGFAESDPFALSNFMRGAQSNPAVPQFVQNLQRNAGPQAAMGPTGGASVPQPITMGSLGNAMSGVPLAFQPGANVDVTLGAIGDVVQRGPGSLAAGSLESLTQNEMNTLGSGIKHVAGSAAVPAFMEAYQRNPIRRQSASKPSVYQY